MGRPLVRFVCLATTILLAACTAAPPPPVHAPMVAAAVAAPSPPLPPAPPPPVSEESAAVPISPSDPVWGSRLAEVTLVVFADFQCPFCSKLEPTLTQVKEAYGPTVRVVWKNNPLPFHPNARPAAEAGAGVRALGGDDAFWRFHDLAFRNQSLLSPESYDAWAAESGVDLVAFHAGLAGHTWASKVDADLAVAKRVGVTGTPATFVNGVLVSGAQSFDKFKAVIDTEIAKATVLAEKGTQRDRVYQELAASNFTLKREPAAGPAVDDKTVHKVPVGKSPVRGKATALVTIIEFADFQCPYCKRVEPTLEQIRAAYGDEVRFVWKDQTLPFHPRAEPAAELARQAFAQGGNAAFWKAHDGLFASQPKLEDSDLDAIAQAAGLDVAKVSSAIATHRYKAAIDADAGMADDFQASGTPHFFINGRRLVGAQSFERFKGVLDEEVQHAEALLARGTSRAGLYDALVKDGRVPPEPETKYLAPRAGAPSKGPASARVVIEAIGDFQCPFTKRSQDTLKEIMKANGANVRVVWRNKPLPMHADASLAAEAAMEAFAQQGSAGFWKMHELLFANQPTSGSNADGLKRPALDGYATQLGLNMAEWNASLDSHKHKADVDADVQATTAAGITGTPAFIVGGYFINGAQSAVHFQRLIDRVLASGPARVHPPAP